MHYHTPYGKAISNAHFKTVPEDFSVTETLSFELSHTGTHQYLLLEKIDLNTEQVISALAKHFAIKKRDIGYAGLKDKRAKTQQWFSLPLTDNNHAESFTHDNIRLIDIQTHHKKLKVGAIRHNTFRIILREVDGEQEAIEHRLTTMREQGFANYFGPQRFGIDGRNIDRAQAIIQQNKPLRKPSDKQRYYSVMRSHLFNLVLKARIEAQNWDQLVAGDICVFTGSHACFIADDADAFPDINKRMHAQELHPSGPLWGVGDLHTTLDANQYEITSLSDYAGWCQYLEGAKCQLARRAFRQCVSDFSWAWQDKQLELCFKLAPGAYATVLLAHCFALLQPMSDGTLVEV